MSFKSFYQSKHFFKVASRFGLVGLIATIIHLALVWIVLTLSNFSPYFANFIGFLFAFIFSFFGHYFYSFQNPGHFIKALKRFFLIALFAFLINNIFLTALLQFKIISPLLSTLVSVFIIPCITFLSSYFWGFKINPSGYRL